MFSVKKVIYCIIQTFSKFSVLKKLYPKNKKKTCKKSQEKTVKSTENEGLIKISEYFEVF